MATTKNVLLRLDPALADELNAVAVVEQRSVSDVAREAIRTLVEQRRRDATFQRRLDQTLDEQARVLDRLRTGDR